MPSSQETGIVSEARMSMDWKHVVRAWGRTLSGGKPSLSIEITRKCPLRCTGCYAYEDDHVGDGVNLRQLQDKRGEALVRSVMGIADRERPLHVSIVGGDPLVRFRELCVLLPILSARGIYVQVVTSAFRELPKEWARIPRLNLTVSIDGLQPEHDMRRRPATYDRILKNIRGHQVTVHCTITGQMMQRAGYLEDFLAFWTPRPEIKRVWFSLFTPQVGSSAPEILTPAERLQTIREILRLRKFYPKLDMNEGVVKEFLNPPASPEQCIFAQTTRTISADLKTEILPCQFGGRPDCSRCGCLASMGLAAVGHHGIGLGITAGDVYRISAAAGKAVRRLKRAS
jgi:sulfatase maturation enzyme AslB (radical SAM superfamily)